MKLCIKLAIGVMSVIYWFMKRLPTKNQVLFLSRQHDSVNTDFLLMIRYLEEAYPEYDCKVLTQRIEKGFFSKVSYMRHILLQMCEMARSRVVIVDTYCIPVSVLHHKKNLIIVQIWHAIGAMKKFGYSVIDKPEGSSHTIAEAMCMHRNYDYICTSSEFCSRFFAEAFDVSIDKIITFPLPRLDKICIVGERCSTIQAIYAKYPNLENKQKKIVLYAPTFRKGEGDIEDAIKELIESFDFEHYQLLIKAHPLSRVNIEDERVMWKLEFETSELMLVSDYIVTDYSAIVFEAAVAEKPIFFYATDYKTYVKERDFYTEYKSTIPGMLWQSGELLMNAIVHDLYEPEVIEKFSQKYVKKAEKSYTIDLVGYIMSKVQL